MTTPNPLCNLSGGRDLIKWNSKEIWWEVVLNSLTAMDGHDRPLYNELL
jgi:hypothetical protein